MHSASSVFCEFTVNNVMMITVYYFNNVVERHYCDNVMNYTVYIIIIMIMLYYNYVIKIIIML